MGKVIENKNKRMSWSARISLIMVCTLLMSVFMSQGWYTPRSSEAATVPYYFTLDSTAVNVGVDGSTNTTATSGGAGKFSLTATQPSTRTSNIGSNTLASGSAETTIGTVYGPAYGTPQNLTSPAMTLAVSRNSSQQTETWKAYIYDYDPAGTAGNGTLLWTTGTATQNSSTPSQITLSLSGATQKTIAAGHRIKIVVRAYGTSGNTANLYARYSSSVASVFTVTETLAAPSVTSISPNYASPGDAPSVTITGTNFNAGATVSVGEIAVSNVAVVNATSITATLTIDSGAAIGFRDVTVTNTDTMSGTLSGGFRVASATAPTITSITPSVFGQGATNVPVTITGTNFDATTYFTNGSGVTFSNVVFQDANNMTATVSVTTGATTGASNVTVTKASDSSTTTKTGAITINARPTLTVAAPAFATPGSTLDVVVTGTGFVSGASSSFGEGVTVNSTTVNSATSLTANITVAADATIGSRTITITNPDNGTNGATIFNVSGPAPTVSAIAPNVIGQGATAKSYTITGTNFVAGATVTISGTNVTVVGGSTTVVDPQTITVQLTASTTATTGSRNVTVTLADTQTATATGILTVNSRPGTTITPVPSTLTAGMTTTVTIAGTNFQNGAVLTFSNAGVTAGPTTFGSATSLTADITVAPGTSGTSTITITNPDGGTRTSGSVLTLTPVAVFAATPALPQGATKDIAITGQGFSAATPTVSVSGTGVTVNSVSVVDDANLTANMTAISGAATGTRDITVTVGSNSGIGTGKLTISAGPTITSLSPASLRQGQVNQDVVINGANFVDGTTVQFNGTGITLNSVTFNDATKLTANVSIADDAPITASTLRVTNPDGGFITGGAFTVTLTGKLTVGSLYFTNTTKTSMTVNVTYTGDSNNDSTCAVAYGQTAGYEMGSVNGSKSGGVCTAAIGSLPGGEGGSGKLYYFSVSFVDADGVLGINPVAGSQPTKSSSLLHNSQNTFSSKWDQGWGIEGGKYGAFSCATCHDAGSSNIKIVANAFVAPSQENWSSSGGASLFVVYKNAATELGDDSTHATSTNACEVCHSRTDYHRYNNASANHKGTADCGTCHSHGEGFLPSCKNCHSTSQGAGGYRRQVVGSGGDFFTNRSTHGKFTDLSSRTCSVCHDAKVHQSFGDGVSVALKNADTGASVVYDGTSATAGATATVCISCHDADGALIQGVVAATPFGSSEDFRKPSNIKQYWPTANGAHSVKMVCFNCHGSSTGVDGSTTNPKYNAHASGRKHVLQDSSYDVANPNNYCFSCHNSTSTDPNKSSKNISAEFALTYKHTTAKCFDCHGDENNSLDSMHALRSGNQTAGSGVIANNISNATGRSMTWAVTPWAGTSASASLASGSVTAEYQVCFKCHAATGTGTTPDTPSGSGATSLTNLALEFNPNNKSGHPIVVGLNYYPNSTAPKALTAAKMKAPWNVSLGEQVMTCSDCHATDSAASKGPHGSSVKWMLAGTNKAWPYTSAASNGATSGTYFRPGNYSTGNGTVNGLFCLNCHTITGSNSWHSGSTSSTHSSNGYTACVGCHIRVPHGGKISRLLLTPGAPSRLDMNGNGTANAWSSWGSSSVSVKGSSMWTAGKSCGTHSSASGGEAW